MFQQDSEPVGDSLALSALCAAIPLLTLFVLLGGLQVRAWLAGLISLGGRARGRGRAVRDAGRAGAAAPPPRAPPFGFFPILWIVINAIWVYNLTVASGHFDVLRRSFEKVSPDQRIQAIIIAFCFGALLEALAGFGTPVAITVGDADGAGLPADQGRDAWRWSPTPRRSRSARWPPRSSRWPPSPPAPATTPRLTVDTLGAMVGRQTPILAWSCR